MKKVTVLRLSGCTYCGLLIEKLNDKGINYRSLDADTHSNFADEVEDLIQTNQYPIVILESSGSKPVYLFRAEDAKELGQKDLGVATKVGVLSIKSMVEIITNI